MSMKFFLSRLNFQLKRLTGTYLKVLALSLLFAGLCTGCASPGGGGGGNNGGGLLLLLLLGLGDICELFRG